MTRGKEIDKAAESYATSIAQDASKAMYCREDFIAGAEWADEHPHWISIEEELPKQNEPVLVYNGLHEFIFVGIYSKGNWFYTEPIIKEEDNITHWMQLPTPPTCSEKAEQLRERRRRMKATELMVGDWVLDGKKPAQITGIMCDDLFETTLSPSVGGECISPIPLTPEILKKNFPSTTDWYFIGTDKFCFRIDKYKDKWDLYFGRDGKGTNLQIKISYVHELQHALRLCGINKEIVL